MANFRPFRVPIVWPALIAMLLAAGNSGLGQIVYKQPPPGSIYREYTRTMTSGNDWRVTDPNTVCTDWRTEACDFLPNPVLHLTIDDLSGAVRAEAVFPMWGGHLGTAGKSVRFNGDPHSWIPLNPLDQSNGIPQGGDGLMYMFEACEGVDVPLSDLHVGDNYFEGICAGQIMNPSTGWGQFGWYAVVLRIYYDNSKPHPTGSITSPTAGSSFDENPTITASVSGGVDQVDFLAFYDGYDTDGDGIYQEYHGDYHIHQTESSVVFRNYVGTATSAPFQTTWSTQWIPDQPAGGIKFVARIHDNTGMWYVTDEVTGLTLSRPNSSVKLYKPTNVPQDYWVKQYQESNSSSFTIPDGDDLSKATDAIFLIRSWNGANGGSSAPNTDLTVKVNAWTAPPFGNSYFYSFDAISIGTQELTHGTNSVTAYCNSVGHGLEVLWPGPAVMVRYGVAASNQSPAITQQPANQTVGVGETATFSVLATGSPAPTYQWQKNGANIGANGNTASYTTPPVVQADSGAAFRCIVSNSAGSDTSHLAYLFVGMFSPSITTQPVSRTVQIGQTATFSIVATGTPPLTYKWLKNGAEIGGADSASYTTPAVSMGDSGSVFRCVVGNAAGHDTSAPAMLTVSSEIASIVLNGGFESGSDHWGFFTNGAGTFATDVPGPSSAHAAHITISQAGSNVQFYQQSIALMKDTMYTLRFRAYSSTGHDMEVSIFQDVSPNTNYGLSAQSFDLTTSWSDFTVQFKAANFSGTETDGRLMFWLANSLASAGDEYFIDDVVLLPSSLMGLPSITVQPSAQSVKEGATATFTVAATSVTALSYQWEKNQVEIPGATQATYTTPVTTMSDNGAAYRCIVTNLGGSTASNAAVLTVESATSVQPAGGVPSQYFLAQNYPNPFNPSTMIRFGLPHGGFVTLKVVNLLGQDVQTLVSEYMPAGVHAVQFVADKLPTGMYLYRLQSGTYTETRKLVVVK